MTKGVPQAVFVTDATRRNVLGFYDTIEQAAIALGVPYSSAWKSANCGVILEKSGKCIVKDQGQPIYGKYPCCGLWYDIRKPLRDGMCRDCYMKDQRRKKRDRLKASRYRLERDRSQDVEQGPQGELREQARRALERLHDRTRA